MRRVPFTTHTVGVFVAACVFSCGLLVVCASLGGQPALAAGIAVTDPITNAVGVAPGANITATFDAAIDPATVMLQTFAVQGMMSGLRDGEFTFTSGDTAITLNPDDDYFTGEVVRVSATGNISDAGGAAVTPYQWQFTAGPVSSRLAGDFTDIGAVSGSAANGSVAWGDYDGDGDLDLVFTGNWTSFFWRNNGDGTFTYASTGLGGYLSGAAVWGDYDSDGDLDLFLTGTSTSNIYRNDGAGNFTLAASLTGQPAEAADWGDYDNDGDLDVVLNGGSGGSYTSAVWRNDGGDVFVDIDAGLTPVGYRGSADWGDYDNDGYPDILLSGYGSAGASTLVYHNDGGTFSQAFSLAGAYGGDTAWGDYDNDGYLDIVLTGRGTNDQPLTRIYHNDSGDGFTAIDAGLTATEQGAVAWGDYDNDGDLDILMVGNTSSSTQSPISQVYRNEGSGVFTLAQSLAGVYSSMTAWGDYDNDGDLDIALAGIDASLNTVAKVYRNNDRAELHIAKGVTPETAVDYHSTVTYTVVLSNTGGIASSVLLTDALPAEAAFDAWVGESYSATVTDGAIHWAGAVEGDETLTWTWTMTFTGKCGDIVTNGVTATLAGYPQTVSDAATFAAVGCMATVSTDPPANDVGPALTTDIAATFDTNIAAGSVTKGTFNAHGNMGGLLTGSFATDGDAVTLDPTRSLFSGEVVRTSLTSDLRGTAGERLVPSQWQFTAGPVLTRCVGEFVDNEASLPALTDGALAWADYDGDGYLDFVIVGDGTPFVASVYRNNGDGSFTDIAAALYGTRCGSVAWGDYDNDGDPDLLVTGSDDSYNPHTWLYRNDAGTFVSVDSGVAGVAWSSAVWGDYDNDGLLDILLTGFSVFEDYIDKAPISRIYHNEGDGGFTDIAAGLTGVGNSAAAWGDYDNDGYLDVVIAGKSDAGRVSRVYHNDHDEQWTFSDIGAGLPGADHGAAGWGDFDNDGYLDILLTGLTGADAIAQVWHNNHDGTFSDIAAGMTGAYRGAGDWGDHDNDGRLDIIVAGRDRTNTPIAYVYHNDGASRFSRALTTLPGVAQSAAAWGDYDNDGDLDLLLAGWTGDEVFTRVYQNCDCPELGVAKWVSPATKVDLHGVLTYTAVLSNTGGIASSVLLTDALPAEVDFAAWQGEDHGSTVTNDEIRWTGTLSEGTVLTWTWTVTHTGGYGEVVTNTAQLGYPLTGETHEAEAAFRVKTAPHLLIAKDASPDRDVSDGAVVTYTITLQDSGETDAAGVVLTDVLPSRVGFLGWVEQNGASETDGEISWTGTVTGTQAITLSWWVTFTGGYGRVSNTAWYSQAVAGRDSATADFTHYREYYLPVVFKDRSAR